ncbi:hypothetical protein BDZ94DRAFT_1021128 [Collybia nuda]|uniref:Uncharacterized protein n=1 Tax=Collybia nuda TaxID=64659 RepID=A0A9P6CNR4_9AGAR|nr:hypothetical protein BDZ94DRAFT_1021128 [Collybia nuda]
MQTTPLTSPIRRKPWMTYQSPSRNETYSTRLFSFTKFPYKTASSSSSPVPSPFMKSHITPQTMPNGTSLPKRKKHPMGPPLPLYHPLGRLALSLPPLDPASVGLPTPVRSDDAVRRSSARARRPAAKLRDEEDSLLAPTILPLDSATPEIRERPNPRKRRTGGGISKRKRKEIDDGDATYPAKRTRMPRGAVYQHQTGDEESESAPPTVPEITPTPEPTTDTPEDKKPERRSTRSRGVKRRDSSASDAASSVSMSIGVAASVASADGIGSNKELEVMDTEKSDAGGSHASGDRAKEEKEDGELSEDRSNP